MQSRTLDKLHLIARLPEPLRLYRSFIEKASWNCSAPHQLTIAVSSLNRQLLIWKFWRVKWKGPLLHITSMQHTQRLSNETDPEKMDTVLFSTETKFKWNTIRFVPNTWRLLSDHYYLLIEIVFLDCLGAALFPCAVGQASRKSNENGAYYLLSIK